MVALLFVICWFVAELFVAVKVAELVGAGVMLLALLVSVPIGWWLLRSEGRAAWRRLSAAIAAGRPPGHEVIDGALVVLGGALLIVPGFIADVIGLALLLSPTRSLARRGLVRNFRSRLLVGATRFGTRPRPYDVDSTATDIESAQLHR